MSAGGTIPNANYCWRDDSIAGGRDRRCSGGWSTSCQRNIQPEGEKKTSWCAVVPLKPFSAFVQLSVNITQAVCGVIVLLDRRSPALKDWNAKSRNRLHPEGRKKSLRCAVASRRMFCSFVQLGVYSTQASVAVGGQFRWTSTLHSPKLVG